MSYMHLQVKKNYMDLIMTQHTIPKRLLPVLIMKLQESIGNPGDSQQSLHMTDELCAAAEHYMESEKRLQPLLVYREVGTGFWWGLGQAQGRKTLNNCLHTGTLSACNLYLLPFSTCCQHLCT